MRLQPSRSRAIAEACAAADACSVTSAHDEEAQRQEYEALWAQANRVASENSDVASTFATIRQRLLQNRQCRRELRALMAKFQAPQPEGAPQCWDEADIEVSARNLRRLMAERHALFANQKQLTTITGKEVDDIQWVIRVRRQALSNATNALAAIPELRDHFVGTQRRLLACEEKVRTAIARGAGIIQRRNRDAQVTQRQASVPRDVFEAQTPSRRSRTRGHGTPSSRRRTHRRQGRHHALHRGCRARSASRGGGSAAAAAASEGASEHYAGTDNFRGG